MVLALVVWLLTMVVWSVFYKLGIDRATTHALSNLPYYSTYIEGQNCGDFGDVYLSGHAQGLAEGLALGRLNVAGDPI